jgi:hypothetical protein
MNACTPALIQSVNDRNRIWDLCRSFKVHDGANFSSIFFKAGFALFFSGSAFEVLVGPTFELRGVIATLLIIFIPYRASQSKNRHYYYSSVSRNRADCVSKAVWYLCTVCTVPYYYRRNTLSLTNAGTTKRKFFLVN